VTQLVGAAGWPADYKAPPFIHLKGYNVELEFSGEIWEWRGPAPYYFGSCAVLILLANSAAVPG
jgi:hypothetical protein